MHLAKHDLFEGELLNSIKFSWSVTTAYLREDPLIMLR